MNRIIVDYKKLTPEILNLLVDKFPDGYGIRDVIKFTNPKGQYVEAVEVKTDETIYLVKISDELVDSMENHPILIDDDLDDDFVEDGNDLDFGEVELEDEDLDDD